METIELVKKFRPIFIFHPEEKYYPINLKYIRENCDGTMIKTFKEGFSKKENLPMEPLYYNILLRDNEEIIVNYILLYSYSECGFLGMSSKEGDIKWCTVSIDLKSKTLKKVCYGDNIIKNFEMKTDRPEIYVSLGSHNFSSNEYTLKNIFGYVSEETKRGHTWSPGLTQMYSLNKLCKKYLHQTKLVPNEIFNIPF